MSKKESDCEQASKPWYEDRVRLNHAGELCVSKGLVTSVETDRILYLNCTARSEGESNKRPDVPGGYVDRGEGFVNALLRELYEETRLEAIDDPELLQVQRGVRSLSGLPIEIRYWRLHVIGEPQPILNPREHHRAWWDEEARAPQVFGGTPIGLGMRAILAA